MFDATRRPHWAALFLCATASGAQAQTPSSETPKADFVVTATRTPQAISRAGSAITVISAEDIARSSPGTIADVLRRAPGLSVVESGGVGSVTTVRIRGAEARHTLVLIDGVRVNDPSAGAGEFDFAQLVPTDIERIEVLRGPQSALYGSDAVGGVINIITRKGRGAPRVFGSVEGGSYGSKGFRAGVSGSTQALSYAFSLTGYDTAGFSRYGYRIGRIERTRLWPLEPDSDQKLGANARIGIALSKDVEIEFGGYASLNQAQYDAAFGDFPDTPSKARQELFNGYSRLTALTLDGLLRNTILVSANRTTRVYDDASYFGDPLVTYRNRDRYVGDRFAAEYQGDLLLGAYGTFTAGTRIERERLTSVSRSFSPFLTPPTEGADASQTTASAFAQHQFTLFENLHLSLGGRVDDVRGSERFATWRATAAYEVPGTATTFRTSVGTGAKAPSLFQLYDRTYGSPDLQSERSFGFDAGIDQRLLDDRITLSVTAFANRIRDLIDFSFDPVVCGPSRPFGCYLNVARARTSGVEIAADVDVIPSFLRFKAAYTHLEAFDDLTGQRLARRPRDEARLGFIVTPLRGLELEPSVVLVGKRYSSNGERDELPPYARLDLTTSYKLNETFSLFGRIENITDARYEEVRDYGTAGRSFYAGLRATW